MADPRQDVEFTVGDTTWHVRFTNSALQHAEKLTGKTIGVLAAVTASGNPALVSMADMAGLTCAGLEGYRRKMRLGGKPWTLDATSDLLDDADDFNTYADPVTDAFNAALLRWFPATEEPEPDPPTAAGTGTDSSEPPASQG